MFDSILTIGTFDVPHLGHAAFLQACDALTDRLIIGVNSDAFAHTFKRPPLYSQTERIALIRELGYPEVVLNNGSGDHLVRMYRPGAVAIGTDWLDKNYLAQINMDKDWFTKNGTALLFLPYTEGISTSDIIRRATAPSW